MLSGLTVYPGPRNRAPLGMKTTNVKTKAFLTPAPLMAEPASAKTQIKSKSPRLRRPKVKVHREPDEDAIKADEEEPEIEYMPPREERESTRIPTAGVSVLLTASSHARSP